MYRGFVDSLRGAIVLFYMDKRINEKLSKPPLNKTESHGKDIAVIPHPPKHFNHLRYIVKLYNKIIYQNFNILYLIYIYLYEYIIMHFQRIKSVKKNNSMLCFKWWCILGQHINF